MWQRRRMDKLLVFCLRRTFFKNPAFGKQYKVIRGGSFYDDKKSASVYFRSYGGNPNLAEDRRAGFRLVKDLN